MKQEDIEKLLACSNSLAQKNISTSSRAFGSTLANVFAESIRERKIIEIGAGETDLPYWVFAAGAAQYVAVEPLAYKKTQRAIEQFTGSKPEYREKIELSDNDALTYLSSQPADSAIIVSDALFCEEIMGGCSLRQPGDPDIEDNEIDFQKYRDPLAPRNYLHNRNCMNELHQIKIDWLCDQYATELCGEIYRVTPKGGISIHIGVDSRFEKQFLNSGFRYQDDYDCLLKVFIK